MHFFSIFIQAIEYLLLTYFALSGIYFLIFAIAAHFYREMKKKKAMEKNVKTLVLIPAYKEDSVILETSLSALKHKSARSTFEVMVVADCLQTKTIETMRAAGVNVLPVSFDLSTKAKSINKAMESLDETWDYVALLDADNIMADDFLDNIIAKAEGKYKIVQGKRTAKNSNTSFAVLDGLSESVNNAIFRKGHRVLGFSSALIGSGFICEFETFKTLMIRINAIGGFDKQLELELLKERIRIGYAEDAIVYDEKIQQADAFVNQRRRWLSAQFIYLSKNFTSGLKLLFLKGNFDYFDKIIQFILPPRVITLGITFIMAFIHLSILFIFKQIGAELSFSWSFTFLLTAIAIFISIPANNLNGKIFKPLLSLPKGFALTMLALFKIKGANKKFIHTQHGIPSDKTEK